MCYCTITTFSYEQRCLPIDHHDIKSWWIVTCTSLQHTFLVLTSCQLSSNLWITLYPLLTDWLTFSSSLKLDTNPFLQVLAQLSTEKSFSLLFFWWRASLIYSKPNKGYNTNTIVHYQSWSVYTYSCHAAVLYMDVPSYNLQVMSI